MKYTWKSETEEALKALGGVAHVKDILNEIIKRGNLDLSNAKTPDRTLARTLQENCLETEYGKNNTFYSVYGIESRKGIWGLTDYLVKEANIELTFNDADFPEGKTFVREHVFRERNKKVVSEAKKRFKEIHDGKLYCEICGFSFVEKYGKLGEEFIEAHHTKPISEMKEGDTTKVEDIVLVCSNCHSMIHRKRPWLSKEELKMILKPDS